MPRKVLSANLCHLSPYMVRAFKWNNSHHTWDYSSIHHGNSVLVQTDTERLQQSPGAIAPFLEFAKKDGFTHIHFLDGGADLPFELHDRELVLDAFDADVLTENEVLADWIREASDDLFREDPGFEQSPIGFERMAEWYLKLIKRPPHWSKDWKVWDDLLEEIVRLANASIWIKAGTDNFWRRCDQAFHDLISALDQTVDDAGPEWDHWIRHTEGLVFAASYALRQSVRITPDGRFRGFEEIKRPNSMHQDIEACQ